jgi:DNA-binding response OmpR family regulator
MAFQDSIYDVFTAGDGGEVLDLIRQIKPDAIVLGLSLPSIDGYEITRRLNAADEFEGIPLVLLRAVYEEVDEARLQDLRFDELVSKPVDSEELAHRIRTLISGTRDPESLPEEPESVSPADREIPDASRPGTEPVGSDAGLWRRIRREILDVERELEKRVAARVKAEIKAWLEYDRPEGPEKP